MTVTDRLLAACARIPGSRLRVRSYAIAHSSPEMSTERNPVGPYPWAMAKMEALAMAASGGPVCVRRVP